MEIYSLNLRIQSGYGKIRTRKNSELGYFSNSVISANISKSIERCTSQFYVLVAPSIISSNESLLFTKQENSVVHIGANVRSRIGSSFQLICKAYGIPRPEIMWIKKNTGGKEMMKIKVSLFDIILKGQSGISNEVLDMHD